MIPWGALSTKHKLYILRGMETKMSCAEGSVRAGKTIDNCIIAQDYLETCEDKVHLASGSTIANAKLNIGYCNGFGLECLFRGRCRWGKFKGNEALFIKTKTGEKIVIFAGGSKSDSYKKILGNSYGLWIATEINEHYDCEDSKKSFIKVALARQIASKEIKILWDLNPSNPTSNIYTKYIDKYKNEGLKGGYNYEHFTLYDNATLTADRIAEVKSMYQEGTVWYRRDILGERAVAQGLVYQEFADHPEQYIISEAEARKRFRFSHMNIGVDFGGNKSKHAFVCTAFTPMLRDIVVVEAKRIEGYTTADKLADEFANFVEMCYTKWCSGAETYADSAEQVLIATLRGITTKRHLRTNVNNAKKNPILDRIRLINKLMAMGRFHVLDHCKTVIEAMQLAVYDDRQGHEDERLDNGSTPIDDLDATEYSIEPHINELKYNS